MKTLLCLMIMFLVALTIGCGTPIRPIYQVMAEEEKRAMIEEQMGQEAAGMIKSGRFKGIPGSQAVPDDSSYLSAEERKLYREIRSQTEQKIKSYSDEMNKITVELLKKKPSEMTEQELQIYLLIEQKNISEQHAENIREWQKFDVLYRTIPIGLGIIAAIILSWQNVDHQ